MADEKIKLEYLIAWDNGLWTTEIIEVDDPDAGDFLSGFDPVEWANEHLAPLQKYRSAVLFALYNIPEQEAANDEASECDQSP
jgi:hypothetical protein